MIKAPNKRMASNKGLQLRSHSGQKKLVFTRGPNEICFYPSKWWIYQENKLKAQIFGLSGGPDKKLLLATTFDPLVVCCAYPAEKIIVSNWWFLNQKRLKI